MIRQSGEEPEVIEYLKNPPDRRHLIDLVKAMGISVRMRPGRWLRKLSGDMAARRQPIKPAWMAYVLNHGTGHAVDLPKSPKVDSLAVVTNGIVTLSFGGGAA